MTAPDPVPAAFAIPGDINTRTGGYIYERRLLEGLRAIGHDVQHLRLPAGFPDPDPHEMAVAVEALAAVPPDRPLIVDGLVFGAIDTAGLARARAPVVAMLHHPLALESGLDAARRDHLFRTEHDNLRLAQHVLVPSLHTCRILTERYRVPAGRITVAPPGVARPRLAPAPVTPPLILSVGILHPRKGHDILIRALSGLSDLDWRAVIVGTAWNAPWAASLARQIAGSGVAHRIDLAGEIPQRRLESLYARASIFALATRYEGYGLVFDEALVRGLPIISTRTGAVPETVPEGTGLLVEEGDAAAFARALRRLIVDAPLRAVMSRRAAAAGRLLPGWDRTAAIASGVLAGVQRGMRPATPPATP